MADTMPDIDTDTHRKALKRIDDTFEKFDLYFLRHRAEPLCEEILTGMTLYCIPNEKEQWLYEEAFISQQKIMKEKGSAEKFDANAFGTLEEHVASHNFPAHVATCGPCKFWKHRWKWSDKFSNLNPVTQKKETWLGCQNGYAIVLFCAADTSASRHNAFGRGTGSSMRKDNIARHGLTWHCPSLGIDVAADRPTLTQHRARAAFI